MRRINLFVLLIGLILGLQANLVSAETFQVPGTTDWLNTNMQINAGDKLVVSASGIVYFCSGNTCPETPSGGVSPDQSDGNRFPCFDGNTVSNLIAKIGNGPCFNLNEEKEFIAQESGILFLGINDCMFNDNSGSWTVNIQTDGGSGGSTASQTEETNQESNIPASSNEQTLINSQSNCEPGFVGGSYCKGDEVYRAYTLDSCDVSEKIVKRCNLPEKCLDGQCIKVCEGTNECTPGSKRCDGNAYQECAMSDDGCFKWSARTDCKTDEICLEGQCHAKQGEMIQTNAPSTQVKRTNEGIPKIKSAEIIFDVVNTDLGNSLEGFLLCKSPDDAVISSTMGAGSGSGAQYVSPRFIIDAGPSQKSITITLDSDTPGEKKVECVIKYAFFEEVAVGNGTVRKYIKSDGSFTTEKQDSLFKEIRLDKTAVFKEEVKEEKTKSNIISRFFSWLARIFSGE